jgi:hypothetical protein
VLVNVQVSRGMDVPRQVYSGMDVPPRSSEIYSRCAWLGLRGCIFLARSLEGHMSLARSTEGWMCLASSIMGWICLYGLQMDGCASKV